MSTPTAEELEVGSSGNIFISYNRQDRDFRTQLEGLLVDEGFNPDFDEEGIASGEEWERRLEEMIGGCDTFLIILTEHWAASDNCRSEFSIAERMHKRIIPVLPHELPEAPEASEDEVRVRKILAAMQYIHFCSLRAGDGGGFYKGMNKLKRSLRDDLEQLRLRRRYEARATAWKGGEDDLLSGDQLTQAETWLKKEARSERVAEIIEEYIAASQKARDAALRAQKRNRFILVGLAGLAVVAAVFAADRVNRYRLIEGDANHLIEAAPAWAEGKSEFVSFAEDPATRQGKLPLAIDGLQKGFDAIRQIGQQSAKPLLLKIGFELASAHYNNNDLPSGVALLELLRADVTNATDEDKALHEMAGVMMACSDGVEEEALISRLGAAPDGVKANYKWEKATQWGKPAPTCDAARRAICGFDEACDPEPPAPLASGPVAGLPDPSAEAPAAAEQELESAAPVDRFAAVAAHPEVTEVFLHISKEADRPVARDFAAILGRAGYRVLGIELIEAPDGRNRSVRYYYDGQKNAAQDLVQVCAEIGAEMPGKAGWADASTYRLISLVGRYEKLPQTRVEIWL